MRSLKKSAAAFFVFGAIFFVATPAKPGQAVPNPRVLIRTEMGEITAEIFADKAPATAANYMHYVDAGLFNGTRFFRTVTLKNQKPAEVKIEVLQGGDVPDEKCFPPIPMERTSVTGVCHLDGTLSMARAEPDSATSSFSICVNNQPELDFGGRRNRDGQGFAAFGRVISGMDVVRKIQNAPHEGQALTPPVRVMSITRIEDAAPPRSLSSGFAAIRAEDMKPHLDFLGAPEFAGRPAPSVAVEIASLYLAREAAARGLKPILPDGSLFQPVPIEVSTLSPARSRLRVLEAGGERIFYFPDAFKVNMRAAGEGLWRNEIVFLGALKDVNHKSLEALDLGGKIVVELASGGPAGTGAPQSAQARYALLQSLRDKGAAGLVTVISPSLEKNLAEKGRIFEPGEGFRFPSVDMSGWFSRRPMMTTAAPAAPRPFLQLDIRHEAGAALLGLSRAELDARFETAAAGAPLSISPVADRTLEIEIAFDVRKTAASNVVGWVEGSDPVLKNEYVTITGHQDHLPVRDGAVMPGADDNGSGAVAMLELIEALMIERPKRSVIFVWSTAEERGLVGAFHFVQHCPVPVEKISANLNLDMISRNDPGMIYFVGSNALSTEFDRILRAANDRTAGLRIDDTYQSPDEADQFFFRSDQFPHIQYGIPGVWIFCGTTPDYHTALDEISRVNYAKMERVTKFVYAACLDIGNALTMMKLDVRPDVTERGPQNLNVVWRTR